MFYANKIIMARFRSNYGFVGTYTFSCDDYCYLANNQHVAIYGANFANRRVDTPYGLRYSSYIRGVDIPW
jgi:hypothetical protein